LRKFLLVFGFCLGIAANAVAYTRILSSSTGVGAHWASMPIHYFINHQGSSQINNESEFHAVHAAFQTWANVPTANVRFNYLGPAVLTAGAGDSVNLISFSDTTYPFGSGTLAVTLNYFSSSSGITSEADILFNPNQAWSTSGEPGRYDIQSVLTHEIGHFLGLDHSGMVSSTMSPFGALTQVDQRTLQYDDIAGVSEIYPAGTPSVGRISGTVRQNGTQPVKGAHVVAVDSAGTAVVSTLTVSDGSYTLRMLPFGTYRVYAEPLDGPVNGPNVGDFYSSGLHVDFGTTYYPNASTLESAQTVQVTAGTTQTSGITIQVLPRSATNLNITRPSFAPRIGLGSSGVLTLSGFDLTSGSVFTSSNPTDIFLGSPTFSTSPSSTAPTIATLPLTIAATAATGAKNIAVNRGTDAAVGSGTIVVVNRQPSGIGVSPGRGPAAGGARVTVTGSNFRPGVQVFFGGIPSSDARFINSTSLDVLIPVNLPGSALVLVVNSDGTNGVSASGFVYEAAPPTISNVSPLSGPPMTSITIDGANFDQFNAQVYFNGTPGRIVSATSTQIVTNVPYGSTTGPVSVSSHGQSVIGPVFVVTAPTASANLAATTYSFTDASAGSGGTNLSFSSTDDSTVAVTLPFSFSLFRDIYTAGSSIAVATNGFVSLESSTAPEFQNGALPAATVQKPAAVGCFNQSAETRSLPRSLIAPFFDDLVMIPGVSTVSTRIVGTAPERRLIIQWSRFSLFDESGCDLHSRLSFQAVLFEGSNDIQFLYESLSGPRSDGISATVGLQDFARTTGIQTSFNEPRLRSGAFITYRFSNGQYSVFTSDATGPSTPVVLDGGAATNSTSSLSASWSSADPESGIREYQYAIGTTPGGTNVLPFTTTTSNFAVASGLTLTAGSTYYFAVRAVNHDGLVSATGISDGIVVNTALVISSKVIPFAQHNAARYTGIAMLASSAMSVTLRAMDNNGAILGTSTVSLNPGQQYAKLVTELFNLSSLEGWVEVVPSGPGLGIFSATGSRDDRDLDGLVPRELLSDFIVLHAGSTLWMVNPSAQPATVTITGIGSSTSTTLNIPPRGRISTTYPAASRIVSTQPLAAVEVMEGPGRLALAAAESPAGDTSLTFPHAVIGEGYATTVTLVNLGATANATVQFRGSSVAVSVAGNGVTVLSLNSLFPIPSDIRVDSVRISTSPSLFGNAILVGTADIANSLNLVSMGTRPASTEFVFPHVAHGGELFTGLVFVTGAAGATITIDVYTPGGDVRKSGTVTLAANQQIARLVSELLPSVTTQLGGYIRIRSDQPILSWEIYGSSEAFASGPPL
jgi:hypothetical protein